VPSGDSVFEVDRTHAQVDLALHMGQAF